MSRLLCSASRFVREADKSKGEMCSKIMVRGIHLTSRLVPGGTHSEASWEKQLPFVFHTLMYELD